MMCPPPNGLARAEPRAGEPRVQLGSLDSIGGHPWNHPRATVHWLGNGLQPSFHTTIQQATTSGPCRTALHLGSFASRRCSQSSCVAVIISTSDTVPSGSPVRSGLSTKRNRKSVGSRRLSRESLAGRRIGRRVSRARRQVRWTNTRLRPPFGSGPFIVGNLPGENQRMKMAVVSRRSGRSGRDNRAPDPDGNRPAIRTADTLRPCGSEPARRRRPARERHRSGRRPSRRMWSD